MQPLARFYGFFQDINTNQLKSHTEHAQQAVNEAFSLCQEIVHRLQGFNQQEWDQLTHLCEPLGFGFIDLPVHPDTVEQCPQDNEDQEIYSNTCEGLSVRSSLSKSTWTTQFRKMAARLSVEDFTSTNNPDCIRPYHLHLPSLGSDSEDSDQVYESSSMSPLTGMTNDETQSLTHSNPAQHYSAVPRSPSLEESIVTHFSAQIGTLESVEPGDEPTYSLITELDQADPSTTRIYSTNPAVRGVYTSECPGALDQLDGLGITINKKIRNLPGQSASLPVPAPLPSPTDIMGIGRLQRESDRMEVEGEAGSPPSCPSDANLDEVEVRSMGDMSYTDLSEYSHLNHEFVCSEMPAKKLLVSSRLRRDKCNPEALDLMRKNYVEERISQDLLRRSVCASYFIVRDDAAQFIESHVLWWQFHNPWSQQTCAEYCGDDPSVSQFLHEMNWLEVETDPETNLIRRRFTLMRLYDCFNRLVVGFQTAKSSSNPARGGRGKDSRTMAINSLLGFYYPDWSTRESLQQERRKKLKRNLSHGKNWCSFTQYLGPGAVLLSSANMDFIMNNKNFTAAAIHALATFTVNVLPDGLKLCHDFDSTAVDILDRRNVRVEIDLSTWHTGLGNFLGTRDNPPSISQWEHIQLQKNISLFGLLGDYNGKAVSII